MKGVKAAAKGAKVVKGKDLTDALGKSVAKWVKKVRGKQAGSYIRK